MHMQVHDSEERLLVNTTCLSVHITSSLSLFLASPSKRLTSSKVCQLKTLSMQLPEPALELELRAAAAEDVMLQRIDFLTVPRKQPRRLDQMFVVVVVEARTRIQYTELLPDAAAGTAGHRDVSVRRVEVEVEAEQRYNP